MIPQKFVKRYQTNILPRGMGIFPIPIHFVLEPNDNWGGAVTLCGLSASRVIPPQDMVVECLICLVKQAELELEVLEEPGL